MEWLPIIFFVVFSVVVMLVIYSILRENFNRRKVGRELRQRPSLNDEEFARAFYPNDPARAEVACRVRKVLARHLELPQCQFHFTPADELQTYFGSKLADHDPSFLWDLEAEFGITTVMSVEEDYDAMKEVLAPVVTIADVVDYVAEEKANPRVVPPEVADPWYSVWAIRSVPILCVCGFISLAVSMLLKNESWQRAGAALFLSGFAIWGLVNGGGTIWDVVREARKDGWKWGMSGTLLFGAFFFGVGIFFVGMIFRLAGIGR